MAKIENDQDNCTCLLFLHGLRIQRHFLLIVELVAYLFLFAIIQF